jgi:hypothetical protein
MRGYGIGSLLAAMLSYYVNQSFWWALLHVFFGWAYVVYWILFKTNVLEIFNKIGLEIK